MDILIGAVHHQDLYAITKYGMLSSQPLSITLEHKYLKLTLKENQMRSYTFHVHQRHGSKQFFQWLQLSIRLLDRFLADKAPELSQATPATLALSQ